MPRDQYERLTIENGKPTLKIHRYDGSGDETLTGDRALAMSSSKYAEKWRRLNPELALENRYGKDDVRSTMPYRIGSWIRDFSSRPANLLGRTLDKGIGQGGAMGAILGGLGAMTGRFAYNKLYGDGTTDPHYLAYGLAGALAGGAAGVGLSYGRKVSRETGDIGMPETMKQYWNNNRITPTGDNYSDLFKTASIYKDPRNYILEKLQSAKDVDLAGKAKLAKVVRTLDADSAEKLSEEVRATLGFNVGTVIAKFIFGTEQLGSYYSRLLSLFNKVDSDRAAANV